MKAMATLAVMTFVLFAALIVQATAGLVVCALVLLVLSVRSESRRVHGTRSS